MFFEEIVRDKKATQSIAIEFGRSSYYGGENLIYLTIEGKSVIVDEATGRLLCKAMGDLAAYLGYEQ